MSDSSTDKICALVIGGYVNGYSVIKELHNKGIENILVCDSSRSIASCSNKIASSIIVQETPESFLEMYRSLKKTYDYIVPFPTADRHLKILNQIKLEIQSYSFLPFNEKNIEKCLDKTFQYSVCKKAKIPYPKSISIKAPENLGSVQNFSFPVVIKPSWIGQGGAKVFRTLVIENEEHLAQSYNMIKQILGDGTELVMSENIPGDDTNLYLYTCFRTREGKLLNEWTGKKLNQFPDRYGVFSSASNQAPMIIKEQGRKIVEELNLFGIIEPEFKYDARDRSYKLMEVTLRSSMPHRIGSLSGVKIQETQYRYATGQRITTYREKNDVKIHYLFFMHEISNLLSRKGYWKFFRHNIWGGEKRAWAVFEWNDLYPFFYSLRLLIRQIIWALLVRFKFK